MTITVETTRKEGKVVGVVDLVDSPDDGGYYFSEWDLVRGRHRVGRKIFRNEIAALRAYRIGKVKWRKW